MSRRSLALATLAALALSSAADPAGADPHVLFPTAFAPSLEHGNANKIVLGRFNSLHAVHESNARIRYSTSVNCQAWTPLVDLSPAGTVSEHPAIAVDGSGHIGVVWVANPGSNGVGNLYYSRKHVTSTSWTTTSLNTSGAEPSIVASGSRVYLAWTDLWRVRHAQFPTLSPPVTAAGEVVDATSCPATGFRKPAIALVNDPCKPPIVRIGYLFYSDEQTTVGACHSPATKIGPRVAQRDNVNSTWSVVYSDILSSSLATSTVEAVSLSMSASFSTGSTVLAWSDVLNGAARTRLAHRQPASWVTAPFDSQRRHVHVRANGAGNAPATEFRFAWTGGGPYDPFYSMLTYWNTATWTGASPLWGVASIPPNYGNSALTGRPQAFFWKRCSSGQLSTTNVYFEIEQPCNDKALATDLSINAPCPAPGPIGVAYPCKEVAVLAASISLDGGVGGPKGTILDLTDAGVLSELGTSWAIARAADGKTVWISWSSGAVVASSDTSLTLSAPRSAVTIRGEGFQLPVVVVGHLADYDTAQPPAARLLCLQAPGAE